jgi:hypothetical protein
MTHLSIGGTAVDSSAAQQLGELVQLKSLRVTASPQLTDAGLLQLRGLQGLSRLEVKRCGISQALMTDSQYDHHLLLESRSSKVGGAQCVACV